MDIYVGLIPIITRFHGDWSGNYGRILQVGRGLSNHLDARSWTKGTFTDLLAAREPNYYRL